MSLAEAKGSREYRRSQPGQQAALAEGSLRLHETAMQKHCCPMMGGTRGANAGTEGRSSRERTVSAGLYWLNQRGEGPLAGEESGIDGKRGAHGPSPFP